MYVGEIQYYEAIGEMESRDPRNSSLKFMYSLPKASSSAPSSSSSSSSSNSSGICSIAQYEAPVDKSTGTYLCTSLCITMITDGNYNDDDVDDDDDDDDD